MARSFLYEDYVKVSLALTLRRATIDDALRFYCWRTDPEAVKYSPAFSGPLSLEDHLTWFFARVRTSLWFVAETDAGEPVGYLRLQVGDGDGVAWVSLAVDAAFRRRGAATEMLRQANREAAHAGIVTLHAVIQQQNEGSRKAFERAGYKRSHQTGKLPEGLGLYVRRVTP